MVRFDFTKVIVFLLFTVGIFIFDLTRCSREEKKLDKIKRDYQRKIENNKKEYAKQLYRAKLAYEKIPDTVYVTQILTPEMEKKEMIGASLTVIKKNTNEKLRDSLENSDFLTRIVKKKNVLYVEKITPRGAEIQAQFELPPQNVDFVATVDSVGFDKKSLRREKRKKTKRDIAKVGGGTVAGAVITYLLLQFIVR